MPEGHPLDAESLVLAILGAVPQREVRGKKRLQKLAYLVVQAGAPTKVRFFLHDFGPFSSELAGATDLLSWAGAISEREAQSERTKRFYKVYSLADPDSVEEELSTSAKSALSKLSKYTTIELEIASTIRYFLSKGVSAENAIEQTKELKPTKSARRIVDRAKEALLEVGLYERGRANQMPST